MRLQLEKRDRICFHGDSITAEGLWIKEVIQWFLDNKPELEISIFNCGVSGARGREKNIKNKFYSDCLRYFPKYVVIMFGMNDVEVLCHNTGKKEDEETIKEAIKGYSDTLNYFIDECRKNGATPIICSPTPYNEYTDAEATNYIGTDKDLAILSKIAEDIARENNLIFVNMRQALYIHLDENPIRPDRVHPNEFGHHLMAEKFLCTIGAKEIEEPYNNPVISPKNEERYKKEQVLRNVLFVDRLWQGEEGIKPLEERKKLAKEYSDRQEDKRWVDWVDGFINNADYKDEIRGEIFKLTLDMYK